MAQLKDTLITGDLRVTGTIYGIGSSLTNIDASQITSGTLPVTRGGTGQTTIANIQAGKDADGNTISSTYLKLSGGTMTGVFTLKGNQYEGNYAMNANNSDIIGLNRLAFADSSDSAREGIDFFRDSTHWDSLWANGGNLYFTPNRENGTNTTAANSNIVLHTGNYTTHLDGRYVNISGDTMTGDLNFTATTFGTNPTDSKGIAWSGGTDSTKIFYRQTANNAGSLVLQVSDDGEEYINFRHTGGGQVFLKPNTRELFPDTNNTGSLGTSTYKWANIYGGALTLSRTTAATNTYADANPKIIFQNGDASQNASLTFTEYDSVIAPASLTLNGTNGNEWFITPNLKVTRAIKQLLTGTGTPQADAGAGNSPRYTPVKWTFNTGLNASDGDIFTIKIPVAGHGWGVYMSVNNGANYYPVVLSGTGRVTTHYPVNTYLQVVFEASGSAASMTPVAGADSVNGSTISGGVFRVINYYDSGNNYNWVRPYYIYWKTKALLGRYQLVFTQNEQYLLSPSAVDNNTGTSKTITTEAFDALGDVYYYQNGSSVAAGNRIGDNSLMSTNGLIDLRYSFNITTSTLTSQKAVYAVLVPQSNGKVKFHTTPITQTLPTTDDGLVYKYLGQAYDGYRIQLIQEKPCYYFKNGALRLWTGPTTQLSFASGNTITGNGSTTSFAITHAFNTRDVIVQVYDLSTYDTVECDVVRTNTSKVTVSFATAPASGKTYRVLISSVTVLSAPDVNNTAY